MRDTNKDLKEMDDLIDIYKKTIKDTKETFISDLAEDRLDIKLAEKLEYISDEEIENMSLVDINQLLKDTNCDPDRIKEEYYHLADKSTFNEFSVKVLSQVKSKWLSIKEAEKNLKEIEDERLDISRSYINALKSPEYRQARLNHVEFLREKASQETNESEKKALLRQLDHIEKSQTFSFLNERLHLYGEKEAKSIMDSFFDKNKGSYIMKRYYARLKKFGINQPIHGQFFNIEENYLPITYEVFNNFFLYHVIRFISYMDPDLKHEYLYMSSIIGALRDLVTGEATEDEKEALISVIKEFYSFFEKTETVEYFKNNNANYKNHPDRIAAEAAANERRKIQTISSIKAELGSLFDESVVYDNPEDFLSQIINEKINMLNYISENGNPGGLHSYEEVFNEFNRLQNELPEIVVNVNNESNTEVNENGQTETVECCDESETIGDE